MTAPDLVRAVRDALAKATPGPWSTVGAINVWRTGTDGEAVAIAAEPKIKWSNEFKPVDLCSNDFQKAAHNAHLIAHAPEWLAALAARVEALEQELAREKELRLTLEMPDA